MLMQIKDKLWLKEMVLFFFFRWEGGGGGGDGLLCLGVGLRQEPPDPRKAHYVLTPWPCVKGLAFSMWGFLSLGVCV